MANGSILGIIREVVHCMKDKNGNYRVQPIGMIRHRNLDEYHIGVLKSFIDLIEDETYLNEETREYVFNDKFTIKDVVDSLSNKYNKEYNFKTTASKINYGKRKLDIDFGTESMYNILSNRCKDLSNEIITISKLSGASKDEIKGMVLPLVWSSEVKLDTDDSKFEAFTNELKAYTNSGIQEFICKYRDELAYINFLNANTVLAQKDKERKAKIVAVLS